MTLKELKDVLNQLGSECNDLNVKFAMNPRHLADGRRGWDDYPVVGFMYHPDQSDFLLLDEAMDEFMKKEFPHPFPKSFGT
jgi:hypothetical protein